MASHIRSAKFGNDWTQNELRAYNIEVVEQSMLEFFNQNQLPPVPPAVCDFCETTDRALAPNDDTYKLLHYLDHAQNPMIGDEPDVNSFVARLLEMLGYASGHRIIVTCRPIPLIVCGTQCSVQTDIAICDENNYLLLAQAHKEDPAPQLIAEAIAAYQQNNFICDRLHIPIHDEITFPGIALVGTFPTFYKIKVTKELNDAVMGGMFPANPVVVYCHTPQLPHCNSEGLKSLENRTTIIQYYEAFKAFV